jgi:hypothetical protein
MKKSRKEFIKEAHKHACVEWKLKIEREFPKLFNKLKVGNWYNLNDAFDSLLVWNNGYDAYGFFKGEYNCMWGFGNHDAKYSTPATKEEVQEALIKEAKRRGYKNGVKTKAFSCKPYDNSGHFIEGNDYFFSFENNTLLINGTPIFHKGKWAEIAETITKEEAEETLGIKII